MSSNMFVQFSNGVTGESEDTKHPGSAGWSEITDLGFSLTQLSPVEDGDDEESTEPFMEALTVKKYLDSASPHLLKGCLKATQYDKVMIELLRAYGRDGTSDPVPYLVIELKKVIIEEIETESEEGELPEETIKLKYGEFKFAYTPMDKRTGAAKAVVPVSFDVFKTQTTAGG